MPLSLVVTVDSRELAALSDKRLKAAFRTAMSRAGATGLRDMKSEATKRVRALERIKVGVIGRAFRLRRPKRNELDGEWAVDVRGTRVSLASYPARQVKKGVSLEVVPGKRFVVAGAFLATMSKGGRGGGGAGHKGVFMRKGRQRLPIRELLGSRPVDALLQEGEAEAVQQRGARSMGATFMRVLAIELEKDKG